MPRLSLENSCPLGAVPGAGARGPPSVSRDRIQAPVMPCLSRISPSLPPAPESCSVSPEKGEQTRGGAGTRVPLQIVLPAGLAAPGLRDGKTELYFPVSFIPCKPVRERETAGLGQPRVSSADPAPGKRSRGGAGFTNSL